MAAGGSRVALVIGNSTYQYAVTLPNPKSDAALMATTLRSRGFNVIEGIDLDKTKMTEVLDKFTEEAYDADVAVVYYAGHGLQVDGHNYLIPVDAQLEKAAQLQTRTISVDKLLELLPPDPAVSVIILDACRDNPLAGPCRPCRRAVRAWAPGLAPWRQRQTDRHRRLAHRLCDRSRRDPPLTARHQQPIYHSLARH